ncbi:MAG: NAD-dependent epimerase/dehydratase family protein, partial [Actinobacteria bacterium]|nr:NAD-dependent epimerase/dehydratase family protein [Actinomycetota bacterium]
AYHATFDLPVVVTRSTNNYGRFQFPEKVIPLFVTRLLAGGNVPLYGDGGNVRDWCHVDDNCDAIDLALRSGVSGGVYNVGAGNEMTNLDLTGRLLSLCGADESSIDYVEDRLGHDRRYSVDTARIEALGWFPRRGLDEGLAETVAWYRDNPGWWDRGA